jgi:hypothetical protein
MAFSLNNRPFALALAAFAAVMAFGSTPAAADTHSYINYMRSSTSTSLFLQESVEGEYGRYYTTGTQMNAAGILASDNQTQYWRGYGLNTTIGLEVMKFVQFVAGHTFMNMRLRDDGLQTLNGDRLNVGARLAFDSPAANLELGTGILGSRLDYTRQLVQESFYGSGVYYSLGLNYFLSLRVSFFGEAKLLNEHLVRQGGTDEVQSIDTEMTNMGIGFRIWL